MKRSVVLSLVCFLTILSFAQIPSNDALYIYRNDEKFNAFFYSEIDSITTSKLDELGNVYDEYKSQIVWTQDSVYWIPLEAIDSVSLCKPEKKYAQGVHLMDDLIPYIMRVDGMSLQLSSSTPTKFIPAIGEVLLYEKYDTELFPSGFAGKVIESGLSVLCDSVSLEDVYSQLICIGNISVNERRDNENVSRKSFMSASKIGVSGSVGLDFNVATDSVGNDNANMRLSATLKGKLGFDARVVFKLVQNESLYCSVSGMTYVDGSFSCGAEGTIQKDFWKEVEPALLFSAPIPSTPFLFMIKGRPSVKAEITASMSYSAGFKSGTNWEARFVNGRLVSSAKKGFQDCSKPEISGSLKGRIFLGYMLDYGIGSPGNFVSLTTENEVGGELSGEIPLDVLNPLYEESRYELLRDKEVGLDLKLDVAIGGELKFLAFKYRQSFPVLSASINIGSWKLVPTFSVPNVFNVTQSDASASVVPEGNLLFPVKIGLANNYNGEMLCTNYCDELYWEKEGWLPLEKFETSFNGLSPGTTYTIFPMVKFLGIEMKASPYSTFTTQTPSPARIIDFEQNSATFTRNGFEYKGKTYYYDYAATTTVELESAEGVEDWGYVYKDPDGDTIHISVKDLGTNADSRYDYYRTIPKSTATLYGYAKYGEDNYVYDVPKEYPLEYTFHPKAYVGDVIANSITATSAQFEYGFDDVPRTGKCFVAYQSKKEEEPIIQEVSYTEKDTIKVTDLHPATTYNYWAYVEYAGETYMDLNGKKSFTTLMPVAITGDCSDVTTNSAKVSCTFENVPEGGVCGVEYTWDEGSYKQTTSGSDGIQTVSLNGLKSGTTYTYCAYIEISGQTYYGEEKTFTTPITPSLEIPEIISFDVLDATYSKDGFSYRNETYSYKFDCSLAVQMGATEGLEDYGYIYYGEDVESSEENECRVSLKGQAFPYVENSHVYYRKRSRSTATFCGYVKYYNDDNMYRGNFQSFDLAYGLQPTAGKMIDLGLSVKWAAWNVGAENPEEMGYLYAWGETEPKDEYTFVNYMYKGIGAYPTCELLGNISGSKIYDAARKNWGGKWRIPHKYEVEELIDRCKKEEITYEGVEGLLFTGPNGNSVFIPKTQYWLSNEELVHEKNAYADTWQPMKNSFIATNGIDYKFHGRPIRAVY